MTDRYGESQFNETNPNIETPVGLMWAMMKVAFENSVLNPKQVHSHRDGLFEGFEMRFPDVDPVEVCRFLVVDKNLTHFWRSKTKGFTYFEGPMISPKAKGALLLQAAEARFAQEVEVSA